MTGADPSRRRATISIGDRGHVPFAVIAVLLLVSSVAAIAVLEQRSEPRIDRDAELLVDRTETAAQSELRTAVLAATHEAGAAPINSTAGSDIEAIATATDQSEAFRLYVKLLVYLEAADRVPAAGQSVGTKSHSMVSLEPVTADPDGGEITPGEAIERVDLDVGYFDDDVENGTVTATVHGVTLEGNVDGEPVLPEERSITVTVGTPVFELNEKMTEYERQLNTGFFEDDGLPNPANPDGLGQELSVRLYPTAYTKASWNRFGERTTEPDDHPFEEVIDTDHTEVLTNHAIYSIQEETFGTRDPYGDRTMRPQYMCLGLDYATTITDVDPSVDLNDIIPDDNITFTEDPEEFIGDLNETLDNESEEMTVYGNEGVDFQDELCDDDGALNHWIFGDAPTGELPEVPPASEILAQGAGSMGVGEQEIELPVETVATASYHEYRLDGGDPIDYLESELDQMERQIEQEGELHDEFAGDLPFEDQESDAYDGSPHDIRDELFSLQVKVGDLEADAGSLPSPSSPSGSGWSRTSSSETVDGVSVDVDHDPITDHDDYDRSIHRLSVDASVTVEVEHRYAREVDDGVENTRRTASGDVPVDVSLTIDGAYDFEAGGFYYETYDEFQVEPSPIETDYGTHDDVTFQQGFETALVNLTSANTYQGATDDVARDLESALSSADPGDLEQVAEDAVTENDGAVLGPEEVLPEERRDVSVALDDELEMVHEEFVDEWEDDPLRIRIDELPDDDTPPPVRVKEHIQETYESQYVEDGSYETPEGKARQQMRKAYFDRLYYWLERFGDEYSSGLDSFNDALDDNTEEAVGGVNEVLDFNQGLVNADVDPEPAELDGSPVHDDAHYEVSGAPTYLTAVEVEREQVAAIRGADESVMDTDSDAHHHPMTVLTHNRVAWPGFPGFSYFPSQWYLTGNSWGVNVEGEYSRFEVSSTVGDPADTDRLTYVAEERPVDVELSDGTSVMAGRNEAIDFETHTEVIIIMPGAIVSMGGPVPAVADGDLEYLGTVYCSDTWGGVGPNSGDISCELSI